MDTVYLVLMIVGIVAVCVVGMLFLFALILKAVRKKGLAAINERFDADEVVLSDAGANFFGLESKGPAQVRGNGALVLAKDRIWFRMLAPKSEVEIPLTSLKAVRTDKWFIGKTKGVTIVIVEFAAAEGADAAGWVVKDTAAWVAELEKHVPPTH